MAQEDGVQESSSGDAQRPPQSSRPRTAKWFAGIGVIVVAGVLALGTWFVLSVWEQDRNVADAQAALDPFYTPPAEIPAQPGTIIRSQPLTDVDVPGGGTAFRILYTSLGFQDEPVAVGGMIFVPEKAAPEKGREVIAWAHPTVGLADQCAPSRAANPLKDTQEWLNVAMERGWVVAATDYLGLGTPGPNTYLIASQEAKDVVNSVRAARNFELAQAGKDWVVWGHSQGGHSSLWTGALAEEIAPELDLLAVGAAAPAAELSPIVQRQWNQVVGWVIGPEATVSFADYYPDRDFTSVLTGVASAELDTLNNECIQGAGLDGLASSLARQTFFKSDPMAVPSWAQTIIEQTPRPLPAEMPVFMSEGTADEVVLSGSNALMQERWCEAGSNLTVQWLGGLKHMQIAIASGPTFMEWAGDRFAGKPAVPNCSYPPASPAFPPVDVSPQVLAAPATEGQPVGPEPSQPANPSAP